MNDADEDASSSHSKPEEDHDELSLAVAVAVEHNDMAAHEQQAIMPLPHDVTTQSEDGSSSSSGIEEENDEEQEQLERSHYYYYRHRACIIKFLIGFILLGIVIFVIVDSLTTGYLRQGLENFLQWMQDYTLAGAVVFILVYFAATVLFIPGTILTLGAGFVFARVVQGDDENNSMGGGARLWAGVVLGTIVVFIGASLGAIVSFLLGRFLLRKAVMERLARKYSTFQALERALQQQGLKIFLLLRLSPVIPFNAINYIGGVTSVSLRHYIMALVGILPGTILYVFLGASAESLVDSGNSSTSSSRTLTIIVVVVGSVFGILALWLTTRYARTELNRVLGEQRQEEAAASSSTTMLSVEGGQDDIVDTSSSREQEAAEAEPSSTLHV